MLALCKIIINLNRKWATNKWIIYVSRIQIECTKFIAKFVLLGDRNKKSFLKFEVGNWLWYIGWTIAPQPESREFKTQNQLDLLYPRQMNSDASGNKMKIEHILVLHSANIFETSLGLWNIPQQTVQLGQRKKKN